MVQYVFTPWRDRRELLMVRRQFYASPPPSREGDTADLRAPRQPLETRATPGEGVDAEVDAAGGAGTDDQAVRSRRRDQHQAVARVSMWMQRGNCPHMVESTALLVAAVLSDDSASVENVGSWTYAARAAYSTAFSR